MERAYVTLSFTLLYLHCIFLDGLAFPIPSNTTTDQQALLALKSHISNDPHNFLGTNWSTVTTVCNWIGVSCDVTSQRVTALNLSYMGLEGTIPPEIGNLSFLVELNLTNNSFRGLLPTELVHLPRLEYINLGFNSFDGEIPSWFGYFQKLEHLYLHQNFFSGTIPTSLCNISTLKTLELWNNNLQGDIPEDIGSLSNLEVLNLYGNLEISGSIPPSVFNISSLRFIDFGFNKLSGNLPDYMCQHLPNFQQLIVHHNQLTGNIPSSLSKCRQLLRISLDNNLFNGSIPESLKNLTMLRELYLSYNNLDGAIPEEISFLYTLERLWMNNNQLKGYIPRSLANCSSLWDIALGSNDFTGEIPVEIGNFRNLSLLSLGDNSLAGTIPSAIFNITTLQMLGLYGNRLSGRLPPSFGLGLPNLEDLYLWENELNGTLPGSISNASKLSIIELSSNSFSGSMPNTLGNLRDLQRLNLAHNELTDESSTPDLNFLSTLVGCKQLTRLVLEGNPLKCLLPISIGNLSTSLQYLSLESCKLKGSIPRELGNLSGLTTLLLDNNELAGSIPDTFGRLQELQVLNLERNKLQGFFPNVICSLSNLGELILSHNNLFGFIPECLAEVTSLRILHLDFNSFTSELPMSLWSLKDILDMNLSSNLLSGHLPSLIGNIKVVIVLDLSSNQLSGFIPSEIGDLQNLAKLSLAHNSFEGPIPESFGNLISLETLDLSSNKLSGEIPKTLEKLLYLNDLNLSFNKLRGEIPSGGPFSHFPAQSFVGNDGLCSVFLQQFPRCRTGTHGTSHKLIYIVLATISTILALLLITLFLRCRKGTAKMQNATDTLEMWRRFSYEKLQQATDGFCESNLLGSGGFGSVYKGTLPDGTDAAIKVFNMHQEGAFKSFEAECEVMSSIRHRNLVKIISAYSNNDRKILVLEYIPNGSLKKWLYSHNNFLDILQRLNVMIDVATALEYLHHGFDRPIVHCDLKPSNVLLDSGMVAHVGDFGIAKLLGDMDSIVQTMTLATVGYMAPEYGLEGIVSLRTDVYSYGVLLMETFTRKAPTDDMFAGEMSLKQYVREALPDKVSEIADANLLVQEENLSARIDCIASILRLAVECSADFPEFRMDIKEVVESLKSIKRKFLRSKVSHVYDKN